MPDDDPETLSSAEGVRDWLPRVIAAKYAERVTWVSTYVFLQVIARDSSTDRRVLLVGEAAHLFAPFGARGLNSGVPDAFVAARAIRAARDAGSEGDARAAIEHFALAAAQRPSATAPHRARRSPTSLPPSTVAEARARAPRSPRPRSQGGRWLDSAPYGPRLGPPDADGMRY